MDEIMRPSYFIMEILIPITNYIQDTGGQKDGWTDIHSWPRPIPFDPRGHRWNMTFIITRVREVIMFSPCVFVTLFVCFCLYHNVCPDDLTMKDWCHTNNILQVHCWGCLVVQVMFHALMTSSMTSPGHKVGQILRVIYLRQNLS